jgi:hypothetical protein
MEYSKRGDLAINLTSAMGKCHWFSYQFNISYGLADVKLIAKSVKLIHS